MGNELIQILKRIIRRSKTLVSISEVHILQQINKKTKLEAEKLSQLDDKTANWTMNG